jgi:ubiquinone/menaquinone biosynthesis C-methylase UbiE
MLGRRRSAARKEYNLFKDKKMHNIALDRFSGFANLYNNSRPKPPVKTCEIITNLINRRKVDTVVDLGCGSGLSTKIWKKYADKIIGIEPNNDMRETAIKNNPEITFIKGSSYQTGIDTGSVDVVVCSQSFYWMEPFETLKEINRITKSTGILAVLDCDWPVTISEKSEIAYNDLFGKVAQLHEKYKDTLPEEKQWPKNRHLENLNKSGYFKHCKKIYFDNCERCDSERFINIAMTQGHLQTLLKNKT